MKEYKLKGPPPPDHQHEAVETLTPEGPHYARLNCRHCRLFMGWAPHPETAGKKAKLREKITALLSLNLTGWNGRFIADCATNAKCSFSPKQLEHIERIAKENGLA